MKINVIVIFIIFVVNNESKIFACEYILVLQIYENIYNIVHLAALKNMHKGIYRLFSYYLYFLCLLT